MKSVSISGSPRVNVGKKDASELRRQGMVPCVIYGGKEQIHFSAHEFAFKNLVYTAEANTVKLDVGGRQFEAVMQEIQFDKLTDKIIHIDFLEIIKDKPVVMEIPFKFEGTSPGVRAGGKLIKKLRTAKVRATADKLPDNITINIDKLEIGDSIRVSDIEVEGLTVLNAPNVTIVGVKVTRNVAAEATPAAAAKGAPAKTAAAPAAGAAAKTAAAPAKTAAKK